MMTWENKRILITDDSQTMRMLIAFHLIKMMPGVKITEAENGADALDCLKRQDVDLILTDMNMPEMDGAGLITAVRQELKRDTPIIIITTRGEQRDRERGMCVGANGYVTKPLDVRQFRETVRKFISDPLKPGLSGQEETSMPKVVVILADGFEEVEAIAIVDVLRRAGIDTVVAGLHDGHITSARSVKVIPDTVIDAVRADDFDMVVLPGGQPGSDNLNADSRVKELIRSFSQKGKLTGAICAAPIVLANAGVLVGKHATSYPSYKDRLGGALYEEKSVVTDGNVLTSRGAGTALTFGLAIVERLISKEKAQQIKDAMLIHYE